MRSDRCALKRGEEHACNDPSCSISLSSNLGAGWVLYIMVTHSRVCVLDIMLFLEVHCGLQFVVRIGKVILPW